MKHPQRLVDQALAMHLAGHNHTYIGDTLGVTAKTIWVWIDKYKNDPNFGPLRKTFLERLNDAAEAAINELYHQLHDSSLTPADRRVVAGIILTNRNRAVAADAMSKAADAFERSVVSPTEYRMKREELMDKLTRRYVGATKSPPPSKHHPGIRGRKGLVIEATENDKSN